MGRNRFVTPNVVTLPLSDGDWIEIKKELNAGEQRRIFGRLVKEMVAGEDITLNPEQVGLTKLVEYIRRWSFTDAAGKPVDVTESAINALDTETYRELIKVIDDYEAAQQTDKDEKKKESATLTASVPT